MLKCDLFIFFVIFILLMVNYLRAECPDTTLYCFDSNDARIGGIKQVFFSLNNKIIKSIIYSFY